MPANWSQDKAISAARFAAQAHHGQTMPGTTLPYLLHLSLVSMEVMAAIHAGNACDADLAVQCAWLHDTLEDTATTYQQIAHAFGTQVADGVQALTKDRAIAKAHQMEDSLRRIKLQPREIWMVKLADRITNLQPPPPPWTRGRAARYREEALQIHDALKAADECLAARLLVKAEAYRAFVE